MDSRWKGLRAALQSGLMRILLVNDDGIEAPGLAALQQACESITGVSRDELYIVAPDGEASQIGHRVTTAEPLHVSERGERRFAVSGTPADCTRLALAALLPFRPDLVLSGINAGGNLGHDLVISGTVAAAREAAYLGIPAIAVSHYMKAEFKLCWETAADRTARVLDQLLQDSFEDGEYLNINLPHLAPSAAEPEVVESRAERSPLPVSYETAGGQVYRYTGSYADRPISAHDSDVAICFGGDISLSRLRV